jgi:hypothetical protein
MHRVQRHIFLATFTRPQQIDLHMCRRCKFLPGKSAILAPAVTGTAPSDSLPPSSKVASRPSPPI